MQLRPRQEQFKQKTIEALKNKGNTLGIAPTGAGKSVMLSAITEEFRGKGRVMIIQHRDELVRQNREEFEGFNRGIRTGVVDSNKKQWRPDVTFGMVQTLARHKEAFPHYDLLAIDEAHHVAANSYLSVIEGLRKTNPKLAILGVTATPERGDKKGLRDVFDNVSDQITLTELIAAGHLVRPKTFVIDLGVTEELQSVKRTASDFDMNEVERIMDHSILNDQIVENWRNKAEGRKTVIFCSTVTHAMHVAQAFKDSGVEADYVHGDLTDAARKAKLKEFDKGSTQVICNVAVLTEGWNSPPTSCVILLRPSSYKATMIQMIGRGLRTVCPEKYPGVIKKDCVVIDFGTSVLTHGSLEQEAIIDGRDPDQHGEAPNKECRSCGAQVPISSKECPICGVAFIGEKEEEEKTVLADFFMTEIDLLDASPFRWESIFDDAVLVATAFDAYGMCINYKGAWYAVGGSKETGIQLLANGEKLIAMAAADDYLRNHGDTKFAKKSKRWLNMPATSKQLNMLNIDPIKAYGTSRYMAACLLTWKFNQKAVQGKLIQNGNV